MIVALVPARVGSTRVPDKNIKPLAGHPLLAYSIRAAIDSGIFGLVAAALDGPEYAEIAEKYGAHIVLQRPPGERVGGLDPEFLWVRHVLDVLECDYFAILRPTSPFRTAETIRRAWGEFQADGKADSLRAVSPAKTNPYKMWWYSEDRNRIDPVMDDCEVEHIWYLGGRDDRPRPRPLHSVASQALPPAWAQNASLEIARADVVKRYGNISGREVMPFFSRGYEGCDLNTQDEWDYAEWLVATGRAKLPEVDDGR